MSFKFTSLYLTISDQIAIGGTLSYTTGARLSDIDMPFVKPLFEKIDSILGGGDIGFEIIVSGNKSSVDITFNFINAAEFELFELLAKGLQGDDFHQNEKKAELLKIKPLQIKFLVQNSQAGSIDFKVKANLLSSREFDMVLSLSIINGIPTFSITTLVEDKDKPVNFRIPMPLDPASYFRQIDDNDINNKADYFGIDRSILIDFKDRVTNILAGDGSGSAFVFGLSELGFTMKAGGSDPVTIGGKLELIHLPGILNKIIPASGIKLGLGVEGLDNIKISIETDGEKPILHIPFGKNSSGMEQAIDIYLKSLELLYNWKSNAFGFKIDQRIDYTPDDLLNADSPLGGFRSTDATGSLKIQVPAVAPIPYPEWNIEFKSNGQPANAKEDIGIQAWIGPPNNYIARMYLKENSLSPTMFCFMPGISMDGGFIVGNIDPADEKFIDGIEGNHRTKMCNALTQYAVEPSLKNNLYVFADLQKGSLVMINPVVAFMMNSTCFPPPLQVPLSFAIDFFFERLSIAANIPKLVFMGISLERRKPEFDLFCLLDIVGLVASGFSKPVPANSPLAKLFHFRVTGDLEFPVWDLTKSEPGNPLDFQISLVDFINAGVSGFNTIKALLFETGNIITKIATDPSFLLGFIPREFRTIKGEIDVPQIGFKFSGSLFLLTPDELRKELRLFHENEMEVQKTIPASSNSSPGKATVQGTVVNRAMVAEFTENFTVKKLSNAHTAINRKNKHVVDFIERTKAVNVKRFNDTKKVIDSLKTSLKKQEDKRAKELWTELQTILPGDTKGITSILKKYKAEKHTTDIKKMIGKAYPGQQLPAQSNDKNKSKQFTENLSVFLLSKTEVTDVAGITDTAKEQVTEELSGNIMKIFSTTKKQALLVGDTNKAQKVERLKAASYNTLLSDHGFSAGIKSKFDNLYIDFDNNTKTEAKLKDEIKTVVTAEFNKIPNASLSYDQLDSLLPDLTSMNTAFEKSLGVEPIYKSEFRKGTTFNAWSGRNTLENKFKVVNPKARILGNIAPMFATRFETHQEGSYQIRSKQTGNYKAGSFFVEAEEVFKVTEQLLSPDTEINVIKGADNKYRLYIYGEEWNLEKLIPVWLSEGCRTGDDVMSRLEICRFQQTDSYMITSHQFYGNNEGGIFWIDCPSLSPDSLLAVVKTGNKYAVQLLDENTLKSRAEKELPGWLTEMIPVEQLKQVIKLIPDVDNRFKLISIQNEIVKGKAIPLLTIISGLKTKSPGLELIKKTGKDYIRVNDGGAIKEIPLPEKLRYIVFPSDREQLQIIRSRLKITGKLDWIAVQAMEKEFGVRIEKNNSNYLQSIFVRPEFDLKDEGGKHGHFYLADMLISGDKYLVPSSPIFLGGFTVTLFENSPWFNKNDKNNKPPTLKFAGLLSNDKLFLRAYASIPITILDSKVTLEGEFIALVGDWQENLDAGFVNNSMSFKGSFKIEEKEVSKWKEKFKVAASGSISPGGFDLAASISINENYEFNLAGFELARGIFDLDGSCEISLKGLSLEFTTKAKANLEIEVLLPKVGWPPSWVWSSFDANPDFSMVLVSYPLKAAISYNGASLSFNV